MSALSSSTWRSFLMCVFKLCSKSTKVSCGHRYRRSSSRVTNSPGRSRRSERTAMGCPWSLSFMPLFRSSAVCLSSSKAAKRSFFIVWTGKCTPQMQMPPTRPESREESPKELNVSASVWFCSKQRSAGYAGQGADRLLSVPFRLVTTAAEEARQAEEISKVVPGAVVVDLVDIEVGYEERDDQDERSDKTLPESEPEAGDGVLVAGGAFLIVRAGSAGGEYEEQGESEKEGCEFHGGNLLC